MPARWIVHFCLFLLLPLGASAHDLRSGFFQLSQTGPADYEIVWKAPSRTGKALDVTPRLPADCKASASSRQPTPAGVPIESWQVTCSGTLDSREVMFAGLAALDADILVRLDLETAGEVNCRVTPFAPSFTIGSKERGDLSLWVYFRLGFEHILSGIDHLLFVLCLIFLIRDIRKLVVTVTAFTVAHSLTLAVTVFGVVQLPIRPVEAIIAFSIILLAAEALRKRAKESEPKNIVERAPWVIAFVFGLLHGFGFASALLEIGLPEDAIPACLLLFNLGVEAGQLLFVVIVLSALKATELFKLRQPVGFVAMYSTGIIATKWFVERMVS